MTNDGNNTLHHRMIVSLIIVATAALSKSLSGISKPPQYVASRTSASTFFEAKFKDGVTCHGRSETSKCHTSPEYTIVFFIISPSSYSVKFNSIEAEPII